MAKAACESGSSRDLPSFRRKIDVFLTPALARAWNGRLIEQVSSRQLDLLTAHALGERGSQVIVVQRCCSDRFSPGLARPLGAKCR